MIAKFSPEVTKTRRKWSDTFKWLENPVFTKVISKRKEKQRHFQVKKKDDLFQMSFIAKNAQEIASFGRKTECNDKTWISKTSKHCWKWKCVSKWKNHKLKFMFFLGCIVLQSRMASVAF